MTQDMKSPSNSLLVLTGSDVKTLLCNNEALITSIIEKAYHLHGTGNSSLPHSSFLRFPEMVKERIIALPAYLGGDANVAGVKWIASFPENLKAGKSRASASIILNSMEDGRPICMMEGSIISASRTAASAALAAPAPSYQRSTGFGTYWVRLHQSGDVTLPQMGISWDAKFTRLRYQSGFHKGLFKEDRS